MDLPLKPIYILADSQPLFYRENGLLLLEKLRSLIESETPKAAYIGASNGDDPNFFSIFEAAMESISIFGSQMIHSSISEEAAAYLDEADVILLAGGDVEKGWRAFEANGLAQTIVRRYYEGAILIGISAGAVQLGMLGWSQAEIASDSFIDTFKLIPYILSVHDEKNDWENLERAVRTRESQGLGIAAGGALIYHPDHTIEPFRHPVYESSWDGEKVISNLLFSGNVEDIQESADVC